ncbi:MAG: PHP domain-containing protein [Actinobacteria bacterium]|nr:PHP domain-containing protein [Actinomycetota bacterium]
MSADLHIHTTASDGSMSPKQVIEMAFKLRLKSIAISDHDTVDGIDEALASSKKLGIKVIPAIELSSIYNSRDIHILGFLINHKNLKLLESLRSLREARLERAEWIAECLQKQGLDLSFDEVMETAGKASVGRPHIARLLVEKGYVSGFSNAFIKYLRRGALCFKEKFVYPVDRSISIIHEAGGISIFAHPGLAHLDEYIDKFIDMGLDGIEAFHPEHPAQDIERYIKVAHDKGLLITGGSDCHGPLSTHGLRLGTVFVPDEVVDKLEEYRRVSRL